MRMRSSQMYRPQSRTFFFKSYLVFLMTSQNILFICSRNKLRSPTAELIFLDDPDCEVASAGFNKDSETPLTPELVLWADIIFVMENAHRSKLSKNFGRFLKDQRVINLGIPDKYRFMDPDLIAILKQKVPTYLWAFWATIFIRSYLDNSRPVYAIMPSPWKVQLNRK